MTAEGAQGLSGSELRATASEGGGVRSASPPHRKPSPADGIGGESEEAPQLVPLLNAA
jgi:hypothetical protein